MRGVFEQLACYTMRYHESDIHLAFILLRFLLTILIFLLFQLFHLLSNARLPTSTTSSIVVVSFLAKAGHVWVN